jgi:hypothetical protein
MPNRILREGILTSARINQLTPEEEVFFRRLMSVVDDYGRYEAHNAILRAAMYPLRLDKVRETTVEQRLAACARARLLHLYEAGGKKYLQILDFKQQTRSKSRYPEPPNTRCAADAQQTLAAAEHMPADDTQKIADAKQVKSFAHLDVVVVGDVVEDVGVVGPEAGAKAHSHARPADAKEVIAYFFAQYAPEDWARDFFDHFQANGWKLGRYGKTPMRDWQSRANKWIRDNRKGRNGSGDVAAGFGDRKKIEDGGAPRAAVETDPETHSQRIGGVTIV